MIDAMESKSTKAWARLGGLWRLGDVANQHVSMPPNVYTLGSDESGFFFAENDRFVLPDKIYGETRRQAQRILTTFARRPYVTGVLLAGEKGGGKTLLAKTISSMALEQGMPTILFNAAYRGVGFNNFLQRVEQPAVVLFDEFEKVYDKREHQQELLTFLDGTIPTKKLCVLTVNDQWALDSHLVNRPGRLFYSLMFNGVNEAFIREYVVDRLEDQRHADAVVRLATMFNTFNFDQLQALVEEMNRYEETPAAALRWLNIQPSRDNRAYGVRVFDKGGAPLDNYDDHDTWFGNPIGGEMKFYVVTQDAVGKKHTHRLEFDASHFLNAEGGVLRFRNTKGYTVQLTPKPPKRLDGYGIGSEFDVQPAVDGALMYSVDPPYEEEDEDEEEDDNEPILAPRVASAPL